MKNLENKEEVILFELEKDLTYDLNQFEIEIRFGEPIPLDNKLLVTEWKKVLVYCILYTV